MSNVDQLRALIERMYDGSYSLDIGLTQPEKLKLRKYVGQCLAQQPRLSGIDIAKAVLMSGQGQRLVELMLTVYPR